MPANSFGEYLTVTTFGESHGVALGAVIDGCPAGIALEVADFTRELARRRPGQSAVTSARNEADEPHLVSGLFEGKTTGAPICVLVHNSDQRSSDYDQLRHAHRPGHADAAYEQKYGHRDHRGGGRSSGRETLARVIGGVVARKLLPSSTLVIGHALRVGPISARRFDPAIIEANSMRCADAEAAAAMERFVLDCREQGDSIGGMVEVRVIDPPAGLGDPVFQKLKATLAAAFLSIGAVQGFAYGAGFDAAVMRGQDYVKDSQNFGGMLGGITTGEKLRLLAAIKPTSSVADVSKRGRHDPCIVPRVIPVLEAMTWIALANAALAQRARGTGPSAS
jgi:chorismate synthase